MIFGIKFQDILGVCLITFFLVKPKYSLTLLGIIMLVLAIGFYSFWIFFTAQRLVIFAGICFMLDWIRLVYKFGKEAEKT